MNNKLKNFINTNFYFFGSLVYSATYVGYGYVCSSYRVYNMPVTRKS